jgi:hypothetical protein
VYGWQPQELTIAALATSTAVRPDGTSHDSNAADAASSPETATKGAGRHGCFATTSCQNGCAANGSCAVTAIEPGLSSVAQGECQYTTARYCMTGTSRQGDTQWFINMVEYGE